MLDNVHENYICLISYLYIGMVINVRKVKFMSLQNCGTLDYVIVVIGRL